MCVCVCVCMCECDTVDGETRKKEDAKDLTEDEESEEHRSQEG